MIIDFEKYQEAKKLIKDYRNFLKISPMKFFILSFLLENKNKNIDISIKMITNHIKGNKGNMSKLLFKMSEENMIEYKSCSIYDRREKIITITKKGQALLTSINYRAN